MKIPHEMSAIEIAAPGGPEQLCLCMRPVPTPGDGEVLLRVSAAGVNRPDVMQRMGRYPAPAGASDLPGLEVSGEIVALGPHVSELAIGNRVTALLSGGGYAQYAVAAAALCMPVPQGFSMVEAAALPETFLTVWTNLFERGGCKAGDTVLIHGGTSGIGTTAIQLASTFGATVFATAGSAEKARACERFGAVRGIDYHQEDYVAVIMELTHDRGIDVTLDMVAGSYVARNLEVAAMDGRIVTIATIGGAKVEIDLSTIMRKRLILTGSTLRPRTLAQKAAVVAAARHAIWPLLNAGKVRPIIHAIFPLAEAAAAHRLMETSTHIGKIMLEV